MADAEEDRILLAQLTGLARNLAWKRPRTAGEKAAAAAELRDLADGRADLLAELAGRAIGLAEGRPDREEYELRGELAVQAGADPELIEPWIAEARLRAQAAVPPYRAADGDAWAARLMGDLRLVQPSLMVWPPPDPWHLVPFGQGLCAVPRVFAAPLRVSSMPATPSRRAMGASSATVSGFPSSPPAEKPGGPMDTVLPTELSVAATLSLTVRCALSMTKDRPIASPRMRMTETARVALRNAFRAPLVTVFTWRHSSRRDAVPWP
ncbi:MAG TPA: hypothetical protein VLX31_14520 [Streptosporangiaceae bacterium]|nr:hypothetical protein [Streptosporangiaceae bacterium]